MIRKVLSLIFMLFFVASLIAIPFSHHLSLINNWFSSNPIDVPYDSLFIAGPRGGFLGGMGYRTRLGLGQWRRVFVGIQSGDLKIAYASSVSPKPRSPDMTFVRFGGLVRYVESTTPKWIETSGRSEEEIRLQHADVYSAAIRLWLLAVITGPFAALGVMHVVIGPVRRIRRRRRGLCVKCGYDLTGNSSGVCPECATPVVREPIAICKVDAVTHSGLG